MHRLEAGGPANEDVFITHACPCLGPDVFIYERYPFVAVPLAYLTGWDLDGITATADGGWFWQAPVEQWPIAYHHPALKEMREEMAWCHTADDFMRLCGAGGWKPSPD